MRHTKIQKIAALESVLQISYLLGEKYTPHDAALTSAGLTGLLELARRKVDEVRTAHAAYTMAVNARQDGFGVIPKLVVRIASLASTMECAARILKM